MDRNHMTDVVKYLNMELEMAEKLERNHMGRAERYCERCRMSDRWVQGEAGIMPGVGSESFLVFSDDGQAAVQDQPRLSVDFGVHRRHCDLKKELAAD